MAFFGLKVAAGKEVEIEEALSPELYISQVCAPRELEKAERAELWVIPTEEGKSTGYIAAVLRAGQPMASVNLFVDPMTTKFKVKGACDLHLTGYYGAGDPEDDDMSSVDLNEEQEDEKMEDVEPKADEKLKKIEKKSNLVPVMGDTTDEEEMEEEDELESDDELERTVQALNAAQNKTPSKADSKEAEKKVEQKKETSTAAKTQKAEDATAKKSSAPEETKKVAPAEKESDKTGLVDSDSEEEELEEELEEEDIDSDDEMEKKFAAVKEAAKQMEKKEQASESKKEKQTEKKKPAIETVTLKNDKAPAQPETQVESDLSEASIRKKLLPWSERLGDGAFRSTQKWSRCTK
ncbi:unnamed protein product [Amoebophrya sp. A25]|nr:unnamed protein product [Amoebophrya sp. A25]|eukprot:GSA25T00005750001.1